MIMNDEQAFPLAYDLDGGDDIERGMTLRDYFAAKVMHAILSDPDTNMSFQEVAIRSYKVAEAMLEERHQ